MYRIYRLLAGIILVSLLMQAPVSGAPSVSGQPDIRNIVVCNVYNENFKVVNLSSPRLSKFVLTFGSHIDSDQIKAINVKGPDGYTFKINSGPYTLENLNGYIKTRYRASNIWFLAFERKGFLKNGRYDITLTYKSGRTTTKGRTLNYSNELLDAYLKIKPEFYPTGTLPADTDLSNITLKWTVIPGIKAHYMTRFGRGAGYFNDSKADLLYQDTIFGLGDGNPRNPGINKSELVVKRSLTPGQRYWTFTEILDSNNLNEINVAIFLKQQFFSIPTQPASPKSPVSLQQKRKKLE